MCANEQYDQMISPYDTTPHETLKIPKKANAASTPFNYLMYSSMANILFSMR